MVGGAERGGVTLDGGGQGMATSSMGNTSEKKAETEKAGLSLSIRASARGFSSSPNGTSAGWLTSNQA